MKIKEENRKYFKMGLTAFLVIVASIIVILVFTNSNDFNQVFVKIRKSLSAITYGIIIAYFLNGLVNYFESTFFNRIFKKKKFSKKFRRGARGIFILVSEILLILAVYGFIYSLVPKLYESIKGIDVQFATYVDNLESWSANLFKNDPKTQELVNTYIGEVSESIKTYISEDLLPQMGDIALKVGSGVVIVFKTLFNILIGLIVCFYVLYNKETFAGQAKKLCYALFSRERATSVIRTVRFTNQTFSGFFLGKIVDSILIGLICFILMTLLRLPYTALISVIIGVTNVIPVFGPYIGAVPSGVLILMISPKQCLIFVIMIVALQQIDGNILGPKILKNYVGINSFWIIFAITFMGGIFGVPGMIVGVPLFAVIYAGIRSVLENKLQKKDLLTDTTDYCKLDYIDETGTYIRLKKDKPPVLLNEDMKKLQSAEEGSHIGIGSETASIDSKEIENQLEKSEHPIKSKKKPFWKKGSEE